MCVVGDIRWKQCDSIRLSAPAVMLTLSTTLSKINKEHMQSLFIKHAILSCPVFDRGGKGLSKGCCELSLRFLKDIFNLN